MKLKTGILLLILCTCVYAYADDVRPVIGEQLADNTFFDPTRKEKVKEEYHFGVEYRLEVGYQQLQHRSLTENYANPFFHGVRLGGTVQFLLPLHFSMQTGLLYTMTYGQQDQHWPNKDVEWVGESYIRHRVLQHQFTVPIRCFYTIPAWRDLNILFYAGPQLHIGLGATDFIGEKQLHVGDKTLEWLQQEGIRTEKYDLMREDWWRANIQMGVGGGLEWQRYRVQAGYDFGLNNLVRTPRTPGQHMWEWGWYASFSYRF